MLVVRRLRFRPPLDASGLLAFFARRAVSRVEEVVDCRYRRSVRLAHGPAVIELAARARYVEARFLLSDRRDLDDAVSRSRALLDLDRDPATVLAALGSDPLIGGLVRAVPGRRVPGHVDPHELAIRAVLGQQVSLAAAATLAARLTVALGEPLARGVGAITHLFPSADRLASAADELLPMPAARRRAVIGLARVLASGELVLEPSTDPAEARRRLVALPGIGPWTAEYVAMRALRDPDAFLGSDLGIRRALERLGVDGRPAAATELAERWRPYRAYALAHLWAAAGSPTMDSQ